MKKIIIIALVLVFGATGCFKKEASPSLTGQFEPDSEAGEQEKRLMDWFGSGRGVECRLAVEGSEMVIYSQNEKIRMEGLGFGPNNPGEKGYTLVDGDWTYMWSGSKGTKLNAKEMAELSDSEAEAGETEGDWRDTVGGWEDAGIGYECEEKDLDAALFEVPADVEFDDVAAMLRSNMQISEELEQLMSEPTAGEAGLEEIQAMMEDLEGAGAEQADIEAMLEGMEQVQ